MRLYCDVVLLKRGSEGYFKPKASRSVLTIFRESKTNPIQLRIAVTSKPNLDVSIGQGNVEKVFNKMETDGKATIRLKTPGVDVMINKADPVQLSGWLKVLKAAASGHDIPTTSQSVSSSSQANSASSKPTGPSLVKIIHRRDYPFWTPFPPLVRELSVENCNLSEFDSRILKLKHLTRLILIGNNFSGDRLKDISFLPLRQLNWLDLSRNRIAELSDDFCQKLPPNLKVLSLSSNCLIGLPGALFESSFRLTSLDVSNNQLTTLNKIWNIRSSLRELKAMNNHLIVVPAGIARLRLNHVDFSGNPAALATVFRSNLQRHLQEEPGEVPALLEFAAVSVASHRLPISCLPVHLQSYTKEIAASPCDICHRIPLPSQKRIIRSSLDLGKISSSVVLSDRSGRLAVEGICCSNACASEFSRGKF